MSKEKNILPEQLVDSGDVAEALAVSRGKVCELARAGELPHIRVGKYYRFLPEDVRTYVEENRETRARR